MVIKTERDTMPHPAQHVLTPAETSMADVLSALVAAGLTRGHFEIMTHEALPGSREHGETDLHGWLTRLALSFGDIHDEATHAQLDLARGSELISIFFHGNGKQDHDEELPSSRAANSVRFFGRWSPTTIDVNDDDQGTGTA
jgi:hypothetical protein